MRTLALTVLFSVSTLAALTALETVPPVSAQAQAVKTSPKVIDYTVTKSGIVVVVNKGSAAGVTKNARAVLVSAKGKRSECTFAISKVTKKKAKGTVNCTVSQVKANRFVEWLP